MSKDDKDEVYQTLLETLDLALIDHFKKALADPEAVDAKDVANVLKFLRDRNYSPKEAAAGVLDEFLDSLPDVNEDLASQSPFHQGTSH